MAATCEIGGCGVAAIGRCTDCAKAFCGSHQASSLSGAFGDEQRYADLCRTCLDRRQVSAREAVERRNAEIVSRLQAIHDPIEKLVTAMTFASQSYNWRSYELIVPAFPEYWAGKRPQLFVDHDGFFQYKVKDVGDSSLAFPTSQRPWDSIRVAQWFAARALKAGIQPSDEMKVTQSRFTMFGRVRTSEAPAKRGWRLPGGSTAIGKHWADSYYKIDAFVFADGVLWLGEDKADYDRRQVVPSTERHAINESGLASIGRLLNIDLTLE